MRDQKRLIDAAGERFCQGCGGPMEGLRLDAIWCSESCAARRLARREIVRKSRLKTEYRLTPDEFAAMLKRQRGRCAVCGGQDPKHTNWSVDHDHVTGQVRGILCSRCNTGIGQLQDDPVVIRAALAYVLKHRQMVIDP